MRFGSSKLWISLLSAAGIAYFVFGELNRESSGRKRSGRVILKRAKLP